MLWLLFAIALLLFALSFREFYQDPDSPVARPTGDRKKDQAWYSKIDSQAPIDGNDEAYIRAITQFYDEGGYLHRYKVKEMFEETITKFINAPR
jgi:hypothetical protein